MTHRDRLSFYSRGTQSNTRVPGLVGWLKDEGL